MTGYFSQLLFGVKAERRFVAESVAALFMRPKEHYSSKTKTGTRGDGLPADIWLQNSLAFSSQRAGHKKSGVEGVK